jgi:hypothetical protein
MQYWNGVQWITVSAGLPGQFLQMSANNIPFWTGSTYPTVTTAAVSAITSTTATGGGNVTGDGGAAVITKGVCWSTSSNPTLANSKTVNGNGLGSFSSSMTGLVPNTTYYVRAYATNSAGTGYGANVSFKTLCSSNLAVTVAISASANPFCENSPVTFTATPVNGGTIPTYQWKVNGANSGPNSPVFTYTPIEGDVIQCVLTSSQSCVTGNPATSNSITMAYSVPVSCGVRIRIASVDACTNDSITFVAIPTNVGANPSYQWSDNQVIIAGATNSTYRTLSDHRVDCSVSTNHSCPTVVHDHLAPGGNIEENPVCYGRPISLSCDFLFYGGCGLSGSTYLWENSSGSWTSDLQNPIINVGEPGYSSDIIYTSAFYSTPPNSSSRGWLCVKVMPQIELNGFSTPVSCYGGSNGSIFLNPSGGISPYSYQWSNGSTSQYNSGLTTGEYFVTVTDGNFCRNIFKEINCLFPLPFCDSIVYADPTNSSFSVYGPATQIAVSLVPSQTSCSNFYNGSIVSTVSGGTPPYNYSWTGPNGYSSAQQNIFNLSPGVYNITVTDNNQCTKTAATYVSSPPPITVSGTVTPTICNSNTGSIVLTVAGVNPPYTYLWNDGVTTQNRTGLPSGTYSVTVTDSQGCSGMNPASPSFFVFCYGD